MRPRSPVLMQSITCQQTPCYVHDLIPDTAADMYSKNLHVRLHSIGLAVLC